jgi:hypothetical protein
MAINLALLLLDCASVIEEERETIIEGHCLIGPDGTRDLSTLEEIAKPPIEEMTELLGRIDTALGELPPEQWDQAAEELGFALTQTADGKFWMHASDDDTARYATAKEAVESQT